MEGCAKGVPSWISSETERSNMPSGQPAAIVCCRYRALPTCPSASSASTAPGRREGDHLSRIGKCHYLAEAPFKPYMLKPEVVFGPPFSNFICIRHCLINYYFEFKVPINKSKRYNQKLIRSRCHRSDSKPKG